MPIGSLANMLALLDSVPAAQSRLRHLQAQAELADVEDAVRVMAERNDACPEIAGLLAAVQQREP